SYLSTYCDSGGGNVQTTHWFDQDGLTVLPGRGAYYRYETWLRLNSSPGVADGYFRVRVTDPSTGAVVADNVLPDIVFNGTADTGNFRWLVLQNYFGNATNGGYDQPDNANAVAWWDDIYISYGTTDDAFKYAVVADNEDASSAAYKEIQPVLSWSDTA